MAIGERIKLLYEELGLKQESFAKEIGTYRQRVGNAVSAKNEPNVDLLKLICARYKSLNARWLILGEGDMFISSTGVQEDRAEYNTNAKNDLRVAFQECQKEKERAWNMVEWLQAKLDEGNKKETG